MVSCQVAALAELRGDHIIGFRGIFWKVEMDSSHNARPIAGPLQHQNAEEQVRFSSVFDLALGGDLLYKAADLKSRCGSHSSVQNSIWLRCFIWVG